MNKIFIFIICINSVCMGQAKYTYYPKAKLEQDLSVFHDKLTSIHPIFSDKVYRDKWEDEFSTINRSIKDSMTQNEFYLVIAPYLASLNDGHSNFNCPFDQRMQYMKSGGLSFPFAIDITDNSILITEYYGDDSTMFSSGDEILQVNGLRSVDILHDLDRLIGGTSIASRRTLIAMNFRNYIWMRYGFEKNYELVIKNKQNQTKQVFVEGNTNEQYLRNKKRYPAVNSIRYSVSINNELKSAILNIHSFAELKSFCTFADSAFQVITDHHTENLIIDIRGNGGGRSVVVDSLMNYLSDKPYLQYKKIETRISRDLKDYYKDKYPEKYEEIKDYPINTLITAPGDTSYTNNKKSRFKGRLFLLTSETTFSGAATFAGIFKALNMGTIIGEETGGTIEYFGDFWYVTLPNTGLQFYVSPKRFTQFGGKAMNRGVIPDYIIPNRKDSITAFTYSLIEKQRNSNNQQLNSKKLK